ncbi:hypothetical protein LX36DRAFT_660103, partial [Colletotrichum falcatum]
MLALLERHLEDATNARDHAKAAGLHYYEIPEQREVIRELEAKYSAAPGQAHDAMITDIIAAGHTDRGVLGMLSAVAMHRTISRDDTAGDDSRQQSLLGGWAEKARWRLSSLSRVEQGEPAAGIDTQFAERAMSEDEEWRRWETLIETGSSDGLDEIRVRTRTRERADDITPSPKTRVRSLDFDARNRDEQSFYGTYINKDEDGNGYESSVSSIPNEVHMEDDDNDNDGDDDYRHRRLRQKNTFEDIHYVVRDGVEIRVEPETAHELTDRGRSPPSPTKYSRPSYSRPDAPTPPRKATGYSSTYFHRSRTV